MTNKPFLAYNIIRGTTKDVTETWINLGWNRFAWLKARPNGIFVTMDGTILKASEKGASWDATSRTLTIDNATPIVEDPTRPLPIRTSWIPDLVRSWQHHHWGRTYEPVREVVDEMVLTMTRQVTEGDKIQIYTSYPKGKDLRFDASNGIKTRIGTWSNGYAKDNNDLYISTKPAHLVEISSKKFHGFDALMGDLPRVEAALREFDAVHTESIKPGKRDFSSWTYPGIANLSPSSVLPLTPIRITKKLYRYVNKECEVECEDGVGKGYFEASNGIFISCRRALTPGYCLGREGITLFVNTTVLDQDWIPHEERGRALYRRDAAKVQAALKELEEAYAKAHPEPVTQAPTCPPSPAVSLLPSTSINTVDAFRENLQKLTVIGFARALAIRTLLETGNDYVKALEKLL